MAATRVLATVWVQAATVVCAASNVHFQDKYKMEDVNVGVSCPRRCVLLQIHLYFLVTFPLAIAGGMHHDGVMFTICFMPFLLVLALADLIFIVMRGCLPLRDQSMLVPSKDSPSDLAGVALIVWAHRHGRPLRSPTLLRRAWSYLGTTFSGDSNRSSLATAFEFNDVPAIRAMLRLDAGLKPTTETSRSVDGGTVHSGGRDFKTTTGGRFKVMVDSAPRWLEVPDRAFLEGLKDDNAITMKLTAASLPGGGGGSPPRGRQPGRGALPGAGRPPGGCGPMMPCDLQEVRARPPPRGRPPSMGGPPKGGPPPPPRGGPPEIMGGAPGGIGGPPGMGCPSVMGGPNPPPRGGPPSYFPRSSISSLI
jgi:hypothetical protein